MRHRLRLFVKGTAPPQSLKDVQAGPIIYVQKGQQIQIICEVEAENIDKGILSIAYNPSFFQLLNGAHEISLGSGSFKKKFVWELLALRESSGSMELQIQARDQGLPQIAILRVVIGEEVS
jgi:hypothetical protein